MMQPESIDDNQTRRWEVGDLFQFAYGLILCVGAGHTFAHFITDQGMPLADIQDPVERKDAQFLRNTGLRYTYQSRQQLEDDFAKGLFTSFFK